MDSNKNFFSALKHPLNYQTISKLIDNYPLKEGVINLYKKENQIDENFDALVLKIFSIWKKEILSIDIEKANNIEEVGHLKKLIMELPEKYNLNSIKELYKDQIFYNNFQIFKKINNPEQIVLKSNQISRPFSKEIEPKHNLYLNLDSTSAIDFSMNFLEKAVVANSDYILKIKKTPTYGNKITIMSDDENFSQNVEILKNILNSEDKILEQLKLAPIFSATISGVIGYSQTKKEEIFFEKRLGIIDYTITSSTKEWLLKNINMEIKTESENIKIRDYILANATKIIEKKAKKIPEQLIDEEAIKSKIKSEISNKLEKFLKIKDTNHKNYALKIIDKPIDLFLTNEDFILIAKPLVKFLYKSNSEFRNILKNKLEKETECANLNLDKFHIGEAESKKTDYLEKSLPKVKLNFPEKTEKPKSVKTEKPMSKEKTRLDDLMEQYKVLIDLTFNMRNYKVANQLVNTLVEIERATLPPDIEKYKDIEIILKKNSIPYTYKIMTDIKLDERGDVSIFPRLKSIGELEIEKENLVSSVLNSDHPYNAIEVTDVITMIGDLCDFYTKKIRNNKITELDEQPERSGRLK